MTPFLSLYARDNAGDLIAAATDAYFLYLCNGSWTACRQTPNSGQIPNQNHPTLGPPRNMLCSGKLTKVRWEDIVEVEVSEKAATGDWA